MRRWGFVIALAMVIACLPLARAGLPETPRPRQLTVAHGLPSNRINAIAQDRQGYLWIATSDGLARFDGLGFRIWRIEQGLRDNFVWTVHIDARDRVWVGTRSAGVAMLDRDRGRFTWYDRNSGLGGDTIWSIASTRDGALWFGTADAGLYRLHHGRIAHFGAAPADPRGLPDAGIRRLVAMPDGGLWIGTGNGVARWTGRDFERLPGDALGSPLVNGMATERDGTLWIGTPKGVAVRRPDGSTSAAPWAGVRHSILHVLLHDRGGTYWFDIPEGLGVDTEDGVAVVPLYSESARGLVRPSWVDALEDREGGLWFASNSSGLWYLPPRWRQFSVLSRRIGDPSTLANAQVRGIAPAADGSMWLVGSGGVLDRLDSETGHVEHVARDVGDGLILDAVLEDRQGRVWISFPEALARVSPATGEVVRWLPGDADAPLPGETTTMAQAADGLVWVAGEGGVQARDEAGHVRVEFAPGGRGLPGDATLLHLVRSPDGGIWLATSRGLFVWDAREAMMRPVAAVGAGAVHGIAFDDRGTVWLARFGAVEAYDIRRGRWHLRQRLGREAGFPALAPSGLAVDAAGIVWVTSVRGLVRVDPAARGSRIYGVRDGLPSQEFSGPPVPRPSDGRILAGTPEGLVIFDPAVVRPGTRAPELIVERVDVAHDGQRRALDPAAPFRIDHDDRDLRVRARLMSFGDPFAHAYRMRLDGFDRGWVDVDSGGERVFSQLPPGDYRLHVVARTADNVWSAPRTLRFAVAPPWWRTVWALLAGAVALLGLLALAARLYRNRLQRRHALQRERHERELAEQASLAKTRFLATFGHEVRTPMTGVLGMAELLQETLLDPRQQGYVGAIQGAGAHMLRLLDDALDLARIESGRLALASEPFDLRALLAEVAAFAAPLARRRGLEFRLQIADDVPRGVTGDANRVRQVLLNLLGNAQKFTEHGHIALRVGCRAGLVRFEVEDTGPGLSPDQQARLFERFQQADGARTAARHGGSGLGLAISLELAEAMGGRIGLESAPGEGTCFHVELPLPASALHATPPPAVAAPFVPALSLLLVEDDATVAEVLIGLLHAQGHRVRHAPHGLAALTEARLGHFDAALLDLDLPGIDGFALARQLRADGFCAPLVAVTARADMDCEPKARAAGFDAFLRKPVTGAMLRDALSKVLTGEAAGA